MDPNVNNNNNSNNIKWMIKNNFISKKLDLILFYRGSTLLDNFISYNIPIRCQCLLSKHCHIVPTLHLYIL